MEINEQVSQTILKAKEPLDRCIHEIKKRIIGQHELIYGMFLGILSGGHILIEGVPGLAKTFAVKTLADVLDLKFKRIQFTPDLLPADVVGSMSYRPQTGEFVARRGPIFANIVLADEINRAPAKVQSALLEAMQEHQVTIGNETFPLPKPFFVLATQNPIEQEGTYPLPEAELDRFVLKLILKYPSINDEINIVKLIGTEHEIPVGKLFDKDSIENIRKVIDAISVDNRIIEYIVKLIASSRPGDDMRTEFMKYIEYGASPRASIYLYRTARIKAFLAGRAFVIPEDVKDAAFPVMRHRIILNYEAESDGLTPDDIISQILNFVSVP